MPDSSTPIPALDIRAGDILFDRALAGTHGQRVEVQWTGYHRTRKRVMIAGVEEKSRNPVTLGYDEDAKVDVWRND